MKNPKSRSGYAQEREAGRRERSVHQIWDRKWPRRKWRLWKMEDKRGGSSLSTDTPMRVRGTRLGIPDEGVCPRDPSTESAIPPHTLSSVDYLVSKVLPVGVIRFQVGRTKSRMPLATV